MTREDPHITDLTRYSDLRDDRVDLGPHRGDNAELHVVLLSA